MPRKPAVLHPSFRPSRDFLFVMLPPVAFSVYFYGPRPLIIILIAAATALICDLFNALLRRRPFDVSDISSLLFAETFALLMPAAVDYSIIAVGSACTVIFGKHVFGGYGNYPFPPAALGVSLAAVCWPAQVFGYTPPFTYLGLGFSTDVVTVNSTAHSLSYGGVPSIEIADMVAGNQIGALGATCGIVIISGLALLCAHRAITAHVSASFIAVCGIFAFLFPRIPTGGWQSVLYELFTGAILFCCVFMVSEPSACPKLPLAKIVYGAVAGLFTMLFRYYGQYDFGACFALLLVGPLAGFLDRVFTPKRKENIADITPSEQTEAPEEDAPLSNEEPYGALSRSEEAQGEVSANA